MVATMLVLGVPDGQQLRMHRDQLFPGLKPFPCLHLGLPLLRWGEEFVTGYPSLEGNPFCV